MTKLDLSLHCKSVMEGSERISEED